MTTIVNGREYEPLDYLSQCESPIEIAFLEGFASAWYEHPDRDRILLFPQRPIGRYRIDFHLTRFIKGDSGTATQELLIETDGREFHDRTPEQALKDRQRDRHVLARTTWPTVRFSGSEVLADPRACGAEVLATLSELTPRPLRRTA